MKEIRVQEALNKLDLVKIVLDSPAGRDRGEFGWTQLKRKDYNNKRRKNLHPLSKKEKRSLRHKMSPKVQ